MAAPFGNHPTLFDYLAWCGEQGCTMKSALSHGNGKMLSRQYVVASGGRHLIISGIGMKERLMPRQVAYFDRRLDLDSPFSKLGSGDAFD